MNFYIFGFFNSAVLSLKMITAESLSLAEFESVEIFEIHILIGSQDSYVLAKQISFF